VRIRLPAETGVGLVVLAAYVWLALAFPSFRTGATAAVIVGNAAEIAILAAGMTLVIATGGIDVSVGSVAGLCAIVLARLMADAGWSVAAACGGCLAAGLACGMVNGLLVARFALPPIVATLAMFAAGRAGAYVLSSGESISGLPGSLISFGYGSTLGVPTPAWPAIGALLVCGLLLRRTAYGRGLLALGGGREAAYLSGRSIRRIEAGTYGLSGLLAAVAAIVIVARGATAIPDAGRFTEMTAITAVVMGGTPVSGGKATMIGTTLGVLAIGLVTNGVRAYGKGDIWVLLVLGLALLASVEVDRWRSRERSLAS
jgi:ribose/xylose/arabinose/galactoside ABC-type transport system permease subunit